MNFSKLKVVASIACLAGSVLANSAFAGTLTANGGYDATSVTTGGNDHTVWLVDFLGSGANRYWQFVGGAGEFVVTDDGATLSGTIAQNTNTDNLIDVFLDMDFREAGVGAAGAKCGTCFGGNPALFDYFDLVTGTLTGASASLSGLALDLVERTINGNETPKPQLGDGANDKNAGLGFSLWFDWTPNAANTFSLATQSGRGDVNLNLAPVPVPAAGFMLVSALIGGAAFSRRKKKAS